MWYEKISQFSLSDLTPNWAMGPTSRIQNPSPKYYQNSDINVFLHSKQRHRVY